MRQDSCIFCKIIAKEIPAGVQYEDDRVLAFNDIAPVAPVHILIIPKIHMASLAYVTEPDVAMLGHIQWVTAQIAAGIPELADGYRVITNCGEWAGQSVFHLHYHLVGGKPLAWSF